MHPWTILCEHIVQKLIKVFLTVGNDFKLCISVVSQKCHRQSSNFPGIPNLLFPDRSISAIKYILFRTKKSFPIFETIEHGGILLDHLQELQAGGTIRDDSAPA